MRCPRCAEPIASFSPISPEVFFYHVAQPVEKRSYNGGSEEQRP